MKLSGYIIRIIDFFYVKPVSRLVPRQMFRYGVCGLANMALGVFVYWLIYHYVVRGHWLDLGFVTMSPHIQSLFLQFPITFFTGFWLNRYVTFRQSPIRGGVQLMRYALAVSGSLLINYALMKLFVDAMHIYPTVAKPIVEVVVAVYSFCMGKFFTFRGSRE